MLPCEDIAILDFDQDQKSDKVPFINYVDYKCLIETSDGRKYNLKNSATTKGSERIPLDCAAPETFSFKT